VSVNRSLDSRVRWSGVAAAAAVLAALAGVPVGRAAGGKVIGVVLASTGASSASAPLIQGGTLTSGDFIHTDRGGSARLLLGRDTQVSFGAGTALRLQSDLNRVMVEMSAGATMTRATGHDAVAVETRGFLVEPAEQGRAVYIVAMLPDKTDVAARAGRLVITEVGSGRRTFVSEGEVAEISAAPSPQEQESGKVAPDKPAGQASGTSTTASGQGHGRAGTIVLAGSTGAAAGAAVGAGISGTTIVILSGAAAAAAGVGLAAASGGGGSSGRPPSSPAAP